MTSVINNINRTDGKLSQEQILARFFLATNGDDWVKNHGWLTNQPVEHWAGVSVDQEGTVVSIVLPGNNLTGNIPEVISELDSLMMLNLHGNQLEGAIPAELGNMENLRFLNLGNNLLVGDIPQELYNLRIEAGALTPNLIGTHPGFKVYAGKPDNAKWVVVKSVHDGSIDPAGATPGNLSMLRDVIARAEQEILMMTLEGNHQTPEELNEEWQTIKEDRYPGLGRWSIQLDHAFCGYCKEQVERIQATNCFNCEMPFSMYSLS